MNLSKQQKNADMAGLYLNALIKTAMGSKIKGLESLLDADIDTRKRMIFYGVKVINYGLVEPKNHDEAVERFQFVCLVKNLIGTLTPSEFMTIFPIDKIYDGERWQMKDYYYTMEYIDGIGLNTPIGENATEFLWEYTNFSVNIFTVKTISIMDDINRFELKPPLWESLFSSISKKVHKDNLGNLFMIDESGKTSKLSEKKRLPSYLKVIK